MDLALMQQRQAKARRFLPRGEATIASTGLLLAIVMVTATLSGVGWAHIRHNADVDAARMDERVRLSRLLADQSGTLLAREELGLLQYLVLGTAQQGRFDECRVVLASGAVVAATDPKSITARTLPTAWTGMTASEAYEPDTLWTFPITVADRGPARLEVRLAPPPARGLLGDLEVGLGIIGIIALCGLLLVYRSTRRRMRALALVRDSLFALNAGESSVAALALPVDAGPEATAWNELLSERAQLQQLGVTKRLLELPAGGGDRGHDLSSMCDAMSQGLVLVDCNRRVDYANGAAALYLGKTRESLAGAAVETVLSHPEVLDAVQQIVDGRLRRATSIEVEQDTDTDEGAAGVLRYGVRPVRHDDESAVMVIIEDVTQQRLARESRNSFVAQVSHELRTPLTNIILYAENAMDAGDQDPHERARALNVINTEAQRLDRIVSDMLSVAELEAGTHELRIDDLSLVVLFDELASDYKASAEERNIELTFDLPPKLPTIQADRDKIGLALHNLIGNALKYTPEGGKVAVQVDVEDDAVTIKVRDTGLGIADEEQSRIFNKFYRANDDRISGITGSGLGLALAREVVRLHGGDITVESAVNEGSVFTLFVPSGLKAA